MKQGSIAPLFLGLLLLLGMVSALGADEVTSRLEAWVLETFDGEESALHKPHPDTEEYPEGTPVVWKVFGSKFATEGYPRMVYAPAFPQDLFGYEPENKEELQCIGIRSRFNRQGYNSIEIVPGQVQAGEWEARPLFIPGRVNSLDLWVWGANYNYYMEVHVQDPSGLVHTLRLGDLDYKGWKNLSTTIPPQIRQAREYVPQYEGLTISKFVIWTTPEEKVDDYYVYVDQLRVMTDMHESLFDGYNLQKPEVMDAIWGNISGEAETGGAE